MKQIKNFSLLVLAMVFLGSSAFAIELNSGNIVNLGCQITGQQCDLTNKSITSIAPNTFSLYSGLWALDLSGNNIVDVATGAFSGLTELSFLGLANNKISTIALGAFAYLPVLSKLELSNNQIVSISTGMFSGLNTGVSIYLSGNLFSSLTSGFSQSFSGIKFFLTGADTKPVTEIDAAFAFAKKYKLTSASSLSAYAPEQAITRRALAKMLAIYMKNYKKIDTKTVKACSSFSDISTLNDEDQSYIQQACEYKLMGWDANGKVSSKFNPNKEINRGQFATILSRILWGVKYNSMNSKAYYQGHINALKKEGIISNTNPKIVETRGFILLMLSRS